MSALPARVADLLAAATREGRVPAAALDVGSSRASVAALGATAGAPDADVAHAVWDLASLTKVVVTTSLTAALVSDGRLRLDDRVNRYLHEVDNPELADARVHDLLAHCAGFPAHRAFYESCAGRAAFLRAIAETPLAYPPRTRAIYSDLGFILLGLLVERAGGSPLDAQAAMAGLSGDDWMGFEVPAGLRPRVQPTGSDSWRGGAVLAGDVHDRNAAALGGVAGHAGLFGTAGAVAAFARRMLRARRDGDPVLGSAGLVRRFMRRTPVPGSSRALGWDTAVATSSCGRCLSADAVGHTGFTGTSLWLDPTRDLYVVLLTNRVAGPATDHDIGALRRAVHDTVAAAWTGDVRP